MNKFLEGKFYNPTRGNLGFEEMVRELVSWIKEMPEQFYDVVVGCDSPSGLEPSFPVAVVILRKGQGGRFFLKKISYRKKKFYHWKERILEEVWLSCQLALSLREKLQQAMGELDFRPRYQFRYIHADVGETGATKDMIKEVIGVIRGNGFEAKIKPEAYVASSVADRYT